MTKKYIYLDHNATTRPRPEVVEAMLPHLRAYKQANDMKLSLRKVLASFPIQFVYLFGSHATGRLHADSDVDIAFYPKESLTRSQAFKLRMKVMEAVMDG